MSYARWGCDGSDVYVYQSYSTGDWICGADLDRCPTGFRAKNQQQMIEHLLQHRDKGHTVPEHTLQRLVAEARL